LWPIIDELPTSLRGYKDHVNHFNISGFHAPYADAIAHLDATGQFASQVGRHMNLPRAPIN